MLLRHSIYICLQTLLLLFKYANRKNKGSFVSTANEALVGTLMTIGDVKNMFYVVGHISRSQLGVITGALSLSRKFPYKITQLQHN